MYVCVCVVGGRREGVSEEGREGVFSVTDHWPLLNLGARWTWTVAVGVRRDGRQKGGVEWGWGGWWWWKRGFGHGRRAL